MWPSLLLPARWKVLLSGRVGHCHRRVQPIPAICPVQDDVKTPSSMAAQKGWPRRQPGRHSSFVRCDNRDVVACNSRRRNKETPMKFAFVGYTSEPYWDAMSKSEQDAMVDDCFTYDNKLLKDGHMTDDGAALQPSRTA